MNILAQMKQLTNTHLSNTTENAHQAAPDVGFVQDAAFPPLGIDTFYGSMPSNKPNPIGIPSFPEIESML